jgi:hypothetical protein
MITKKEAVNQQENHLPKFDEVIKIEVPVNQIYEKLKAVFPEDYKHKEVLAHAIVGSTVSHGGVEFVYNALCGFTNDIDFKVGDKVICTEKERKENLYAAQGKSLTDQEDVEIGECEIVQINLYAKDKIRVAFKERGWKSEEYIDAKEWVNQKSCTKVWVGIDKG